MPYYYSSLTDDAWKTELRAPGSAAAEAAGAAAPPVVGDEHFGLVTADRLEDKGLLDEGAEE